MVIEDSGGKYAVGIEIELGEYILVRDTNPFSEDSNVLWFDTYEEAKVEAAKWRTGRVVSVAKGTLWGEESHD